MAGYSSLRWQSVVLVLAVVASVLWAVAAPAAADGETYVVTTGEDEFDVHPEDCIDPNPPETLCSFREAVEAANGDPQSDEIVFDVDGDVRLRETVFIVHSVTVTGPVTITLDELEVLASEDRSFPRLITVLPEGELFDDTSTLSFDADPIDVLLEQVVLTGGSAPLGGNVLAEGPATTLTIRDSEVSHGDAIIGGGIAVHFGADLTLDGTDVHDNAAYIGGGVFHSTFDFIDYEGFFGTSVDDPVDEALEALSALSDLTVQGGSAIQDNGPHLDDDVDSAFAEHEDNYLLELFAAVCGLVVEGLEYGGLTAGAGIATCGTAMSVTHSQITGNDGADLGSGVFSVLTIPQFLDDYEEGLEAVEEAMDSPELPLEPDALALFTDSVIRDNDGHGIGGGILTALSGGFLLRTEVSDNDVAARERRIPSRGDERSYDFGYDCDCPFSVPAIGGGVVGLVSLLGNVDTTIAGNTAQANGAGLVTFLAPSLSLFSTIADNHVVEPEDEEVPFVTLDEEPLEAPGPGEDVLSIGGLPDEVIEIGPLGDVAIDTIEGDPSRFDQVGPEDGLPILFVNTIVSDPEDEDDGLPACSFFLSPAVGVGNMTDDASCPSDRDASPFQLLDDLRLGDLALNGAPNGTRTLALLTGSPALDAAEEELDAIALFAGESIEEPALALCNLAGALISDDQRGLPRPGNGTPGCDVGAYEYQVPPPSPPPPPPPPPVDPTDPPVDPTDVVIDRLGGPTRVETAVMVSQVHPDESATDILLARFDVPADALTAIRLAEELGAPLLLTQPTELHPAVAEEIQRVGAPGDTTVWLVGGTEALSQDVESAVQALDVDTARLAGLNRFHTATLVADQLVADGALAQADAPSVLLADGGDFPAPTVAGVAAAHIGGLVLLTSGTDMPPETAAWLAAHPTAVPTAIGGAAGGALPTAPQVGVDEPSGLSAAVAAEFFDDPAVAGVATRDVFPDSLVGAIDIAAQGGPMLLTDPAELPMVLQEYLQGPGATIQEVTVYGGTSAVSDDVVDDIRGVLEG